MAMGDTNNNNTEDNVHVSPFSGPAFSTFWLYPKYCPAFSSPAFSDYCSFFGPSSSGPAFSVHPCCHHDLQLLQEFIGKKIS